MLSDIELSSLLFSERLFEAHVIRVVNPYWDVLFLVVREQNGRTLVEERKGNTCEGREEKGKKFDLFSAP